VAGRGGGLGAKSGLRRVEFGSSSPPIGGMGVYPWSVRAELAVLEGLGVWFWMNEGSPDGRGRVVCSVRGFVTVATRCATAAVQMPVGAVSREQHVAESCMCTWRHAAGGIGP